MKTRETRTWVLAADEWHRRERRWGGASITGMVGEMTDDRPGLFYNICSVCRRNQKTQINMRWLFTSAMHLPAHLNIFLRIGNKITFIRITGTLLLIQNLLTI